MTEDLSLDTLICAILAAVSDLVHAGDKSARELAARWEVDRIAGHAAWDTVPAIWPVVA